MHVLVITDNRTMMANIIGQVFRALHTYMSLCSIDDSEMFSAGRGLCVDTWGLAVGASFLQISSHRPPDPVLLLKCPL